MSKDKDHAKEAQMEENIENQIQNVENELGGIVEEHKSILREEQDALGKLDVAMEVLEHSEKLERRLIDENYADDGIDEEISVEIAEVMTILTVVSEEISDIASKMETEEGDLKSLSQIEKKVFGRSQELARTHKAVTDMDVSDVASMDTLENRYRSMSASELKTEVESKF